RRNKEDSSTIGSIRSKIYEKLNKEPIPCLISPEWFFGNPDDLRVEYRELAFDQAKHIFFYVSSGYYSETAEIEFLNSFHEFNQDFFKDPENYFKLLEYGLSSLRLNTQIDDPLTDFFESQLADEEALRDFQAGQIGILIGYSLKNGIDMNTAFSQRISFYDKKTDRISQIQSEHYHALYELYLNENNPLFYETVTFDNLDEIIDYSVTNPD
ncbi:MAG: hypothetical protein NDI94_04585, partial [Candidatus Woesearchaeota archaeon]|nr:hypothetical protein [Candidatus Woesearchaeota archaeon]